ncbi:MAG: hypothetical protein CVV64_19800 [Candidatus Wallbacteria bacterium HGW-Wallbacteria-1]|jgi:membrane fusion protein (multidrug efflux system)|uniref:Uncharacterized protein n=1 Tax=Candidatus Wallbacteria bacterium HGW-Wallbacteria-1 TaxID=2013854 RepID=A0A2N1PIT1_9BACT|nr:MAG: hypothetical protein CVV64_19800 [Candidatus Wallbacteria bacterium HGW-Wallbacteria-1]
MKKYIILAILISVVCYYSVNARLHEIQGGAQVTNIDAIKVSQGVPVVAVKPLLNQSVRELRSFTGNIEAFKKVTVSAHLGEEITRSDLTLGMQVTEGQEVLWLRDDMVKADLALAQAAVDQAKSMLDKAEAGARPQELEQAKANVEAAEATMKNASRDYQRMKELDSKGAIPKQQADRIIAGYEGAKAGLDAAKQQLSMVREGAREEDVRAARAGYAQATARLEQAGIRLGFTIVKSPLNGLVAEIEKEVAEQAAVGKPLFAIVDIRQVYLAAEVPEQFINRITPGMEAICTTVNLPGVSFRGKVQEICPEASAMNRVFKVKILVENPDFILKPGMFAAAEVVLDQIADACVIPMAAVVQLESGNRIFCIRDGRAIAMDVNVKNIGEGKVQVTPAIAEDLMVVTEGTRDIMDGSKVICRETL